MASTKECVSVECRRQEYKKASRLLFPLACGIKRAIGKMVGRPFSIAPCNPRLVKVGGCLFSSGGFSFFLLFLVASFSSFVSLGWFEIVV
jgi:hypothetical protein